MPRAASSINQACHLLARRPLRGSNIQRDSAQPTAPVRKMAAGKMRTVIPSIRSPGQTQRIPSRPGDDRRANLTGRAERPSHCCEDAQNWTIGTISGKRAPRVSKRRFGN